MGIRWSLKVLLPVIALQPASAQPAPPNLMIVAQAYDRCMATYAVRLTRTEASDEEIFAQATQSCAPLDQQVRAGITAQLPPPQAAEFIRSMDAKAKPNFMAMLTRIRDDRAKQTGG